MWDIGRFIVVSVTVLLRLTSCDKGSAQTMRFASINKRPRSKLRGIKPAEFEEKRDLDFRCWPR